MRTAEYRGKRYICLSQRQDGKVGIVPKLGATTLWVEPSEIQLIVPYTPNLPDPEVTELQLCEAIAALLRGIDLACKRTAIIQPFLSIYKKRIPVLLYAEKFVAQAALKPKAHCEFCPGVDKPHGPHEEVAKKPRRP